LKNFSFVDDVYLLASPFRARNKANYVKIRGLVAEIEDFTKTKNTLEDCFDSSFFQNLSFNSDLNSLPWVHKSSGKFPKFRFWLPSLLN
jgi:hypothetical protein